VSEGEPATSQFTATDARELKHPACGRCGQPMWLMRIRPDTIGRQIRTFECTDCGQTSCLSVAIGPPPQK
jgi:hypothetical protein